MMRFLKSILLRSKREDTSLQSKIARLEEELDAANGKIAELSTCVKHVAVAVSNLSADLSYITGIIQHAAATAQADSDRFLLHTEPDDDDEGLLN